MLDQEIEQAKARRRSHFAKAVIVILSLVAVLCVFWLLNTLVLKRGKGDPAPAIATPSVENPVVNTSSANIDAERKQFQQQLAAFEEELAPLLLKEDLQRWDKETVATITANKDESLALFAQGAYSAAIDILEKASHLLRQLHRHWQTAYEEKLQQAQSAYQQQEIKRAQLYLNQALKINTSEQRGLLLQQQLLNYPRIAEAQQRLKVANIENDLPKQVTILQEMIALDTSQTEWVEELKRLQTQISNTAFNQHIQRGLEAANNNQLSAASAAYQQAKAIDPKRVELSHLQRKIAQKRSARALRSTLDKAGQAAQADDWSRVAEISQASSNKGAALQAYREDAQQILALQQQADSYLAQPQRLRDVGVRQQASDFVKSALSSVSKSPRLAQQLHDLSTALSQAEKKQRLTVYSDGKTDIWVVGVGHIGKTTEKTLTLLPGDYWLEGRCQGYRDKRVAVSLAATSTKQQVRVVCDERIR